MTADPCYVILDVPESLITRVIRRPIRLDLCDIWPRNSDMEESDDSDERHVRFLTKATDVYAFSMLSVEVGLSQMISIPVFRRHYHRFVWTATPSEDT